MVADVPLRLPSCWAAVSVLSPRVIRLPSYFYDPNRHRRDQKSRKTCAEVGQFLLRHPNIASRAAGVYRQPDSMVGTVNMTPTRLPTPRSSTRSVPTKLPALTVDCNSRYVHADPEQGCTPSPWPKPRAHRLAPAVNLPPSPTAPTSAISNRKCTGSSSAPSKGMGKACREVPDTRHRRQQ